MIILPGFDCANPQCQGWTGTAKEDHKVCRFCGTPRPVAPVPLYRIRQTRWHVKYTEANEPTPDELSFADALSEAQHLRENYPTHAFEVVPANAPLVHDIVSLQQEYGAMFQQLTLVQTRCKELLEEKRALKQDIRNKLRDAFTEISFHSAGHGHPACVAEHEDLYCCIEPGHVGFNELVDHLVAALEKA